MTADANDRGFALQRAVSVAALAALTAANLIGVWLALLLVAPDLGSHAGALTYGRWMPLHLNLQLYGWCSVPLVGLLFARYLPPENRRLLAAAQAALAWWCGALVAGALSWLGGHTSGKIFLDWTGPAALVFTVAQLFTWVVLACGWSLRLQQARTLSGLARSRVIVDGVLLAGLLAVPVVLHLAEDPASYPPVNPHSGGATGHSLLASSLGVIGLAIALPGLLGNRPRARSHLHRATTGMLLGYAANWVVYASIHHGNASHLEISQTIGLATLLVWPIWLVWWFRLFVWAPDQRRWLWAAGIWAALLVLDGYALFLPGILERTKFTNALVAHAHLAMAGALTGLNQLILISLAPTSRLASALSARMPWLAWNVGCLVMVVALTALGWREGETQRLLADGDQGVTLVYLLRLGAGIMMTAASIRWMVNATTRMRPLEQAQSEPTQVDAAFVEQGT